MKKKFLPLVLLDIIAITLISFNRFFFYIPELISIAAALLVFAATVIFSLKSSSRKRTKIIMCILAFFTITISILGNFCNPYWNSISSRVNSDFYSNPYDDTVRSDEALKDLEYAMKYLKKLHPALYRETPQEISLQYEKIKSELTQCSVISVNELGKKIESIFSILQDGHTYVRGNYEDRRVLKYYRQWKSEGYDITAVNGVSVSQLLKDNSAFYSYEVESWEYEWLSDDIVTISGLDYLGFDIENGIQYTLTSAAGQTRTETCHKEDFLPWDEYAAFNHIDDSENENESFVRYEIDNENSLAILDLDACNYNDEYISCLREMFEKVKAGGIQNVAVDIRNNGGGNDMVVREFFRYLDIDTYKITSMTWRLGFLCVDIGDGITENNRYEDYLFHGRLYLLTSAGTFSSAMEFAEYVSDNELGLIIGEAPGNNPNGYGEIVCFKLPHSELFMQISTKRFYRADKECTDQLVIPDLPCDADSAMDELYRQLKEQ